MQCYRIWRIFKIAKQYFLFVKYQIYQKQCCKILPI